MSTLKDFNYEDIKVIGRGQYGKAHLVRSGEDQGFYIAKTIDLTCLSSKERETALQEVALLRRLDHPNIVAYKDNFFMADTLVIIMQYCEGGDLQTYIKDKFKEKQRVREVQIMHYFVQVLQALQYIHGERILHRDLKTSNLFLMKSKQVVKLGDFGISRVLEGSIEAAMTVVGTPYYMSPEVCVNKPYTYKSDVWSLGCVLYELCMLKHAFSADNLLGLVYKIVSDKYEPIPKMYSSALNVLIQRMLEKEAEKRPSVRDLLADNYVHRFISEFVRTRGQVAAPAPATESKVAKAPKAANSAQKGAPAAQQETPSQAALRRKREAADRQAAALKVAARQADHNKMVAKQKMESEFQSTQLGHGMTVTRPAMTAGSIPEEYSEAPLDADPQEVDSEDDDSYSDDGTEYEDDFVSEDESEEANTSEREVAMLRPRGDQQLAVREEEDITRVMANYEHDLSQAHGASPPVGGASASPAHRTSSSSVGVAASAGSDQPIGGAAMNMQSRAGKLREELIQKMGHETFQQSFDYLMQARKKNLEQRVVKRELEALIGRDTYKRFGFDVDQLVFQQTLYS